MMPYFLVYILSNFIYSTCLYIVDGLNQIFFHRRFWNLQYIVNENRVFSTVFWWLFNYTTANGVVVE